MSLLIIIACLLLGVGSYNLACAFTDVPTIRASRVMQLTVKEQGREKPLDLFITRMAMYLEQFITLDKLKRSKLQNTLVIAGINVSPEVYTLKAYVTAGLIGLFAIPLFFAQPLFSMIVIGLAVTVWFSSYYFAFDLVRKRRKLIEAEIPRFAITIMQNLENDRDVLKILSEYRNVTGKEFRQELDQTIADMKTGNYENALIRFEGRIGSTLLSDVVRGLIGTLRGDDQRMYFKMICFDMRQIEHNNLKKEAAKRPAKIQRYSMMMLFCIIIIYAVVLVTEVVGNLGVFFG